MRAPLRVPIALSKVRRKRLETNGPIGSRGLARVLTLTANIQAWLELVGAHPPPSHEPLNTGIRRSPTRSGRKQEGEEAWNGCRASGCKTLAIPESKPEQERAHQGSW